MVIWFSKMTVPLFFIVIFAIAYLLGILRSLFARFIGYNLITFLKIKYIRPIPYKRNMNRCRRFLTWSVRQIIWYHNMIIWAFKQKSSFHDFKILFNRILNSFSAYVSFLFIFMITNAAEIFVCTKQNNGSFTLNESPNILWLVNPLTKCKLSK
jgi:hypothetical protein